MRASQWMVAAMLAWGQTSTSHPVESKHQPSRANVVFGMHSGLALLLDVYSSARPNGRGVVLIPGSGFHRPLGYDATALKEEAGIDYFLDPLLAGGYTVFVINHRAAPRFRHPAALEDAERAVRFVRANAAAFKLNTDRLTVAGYSSGATLASLLGVIEEKPRAASSDPVDRASGRAQCVIAGAGAYDLVTLDSRIASPLVASYLGLALPLAAKDGPEYKAYRDASPLHHVSRDDAPHFLFHPDRDEVVPPRQADAMQTALQQAGVGVVAARVPEATHAYYLKATPAQQRVMEDAVEWLGGCLKP